MGEARSVGTRVEAVRVGTQVGQVRQLKNYVLQIELQSGGSGSMSHMPLHFGNTKGGFK